MKIVDIRDAETSLPELLKRAQAGEEIVIGIAGKPVARLIPYRPAAQVPKRKPGALKGKIWISPDFDKYDREIEKLFYGELD